MGSATNCYSDSFAVQEDRFSPISVPAGYPRCTYKFSAHANPDSDSSDHLLSGEQCCSPNLMFDGWPRSSLIKTATANPDSDRFDYLLVIILGWQSTPLPTGSVLDAFGSRTAPVTDSPKSDQFALSEHEWPTLNEAAIQPKVRKGKKKLTQGAELPFHEDSLALKSKGKQPETPAGLSLAESRRMFALAHIDDLVQGTAADLLGNRASRASQKRWDVLCGWLREQILSGAWDDHPAMETSHAKSPKPESERDADSEDQATRAAPAMVDELVDLDRIDISNPGSLKWCAIQVQGVSSPIEGPIIGNAFGPTKGYNIMVDIEAGRYGLPQLILSCGINKPRKRHNVFAESVSIHAHERYEFKAIWRPGVRVHDEYMMEEMHIQAMRDSRRGQHPYVQAIVDMSRKAKAEDGYGNKNHLSRITAMTFVANATRIETHGGDVHWSCWEGLPKDVRDTFNRIFLEENAIRITIWLKVFPNPKAAMYDWGRFLQTQVNMHVPPCAQYQHPDGRPYWDPHVVRLNKEYANSIDDFYPSFVGQMRMYDWQNRHIWGPIWRAEQAASYERDYKIAKRARIVDEEVPDIPLYNTRIGLTRRPIDMEPAAKGADSKEY